MLANTRYFFPSAQSPFVCLKYFAHANSIHCRFNVNFGMGTNNPLSIELYVQSTNPFANAATKNRRQTS